MKCNKCTKKATVHLTEIIDGKVMEMHLCEDCARAQSQQMEQQFGLADLLAGLTDFGKHVPDVQQAVSVLKCATCGLTYEDFRKFGRFGCAQCYVAFKAQLKALLKKIHGASVHLGKRPSREISLAAVPQPSLPGDVAPVPQEDTVESLRAKLQAAIVHEDFEQAASLRDKIYGMEGRS